MYFGKNFILALCLTISTSLQWGDKCVSYEPTSQKGTCQNFLECDSIFLYNHKPENYCDEAKNLLCCPRTSVNTECFDELTGFAGRCQNLLECNYYVLSYRKKPKYCSDRTVCCPLIQLRLSEKMCLEYHTEKDTGVDGVQTDNVTVGKKVLRKSSHMAAIAFQPKTLRKIIWDCAGSIISPVFILSAAHCTEHIFFGPAKWVRIRDLDQLPSFEKIEQISHQDFRIVETFIHPDYTQPFIYNDIALFKLEKEIIFGGDYQPACLHTETNVPEIMEDTLRELNKVLSVRDLKVIESKSCALLHRNYRRFLPNGVIDELQICGWDVLGNLRCADEFRGPLQYKVEEFENVREHYVVAGIQSRALICRFSPAQLYTRISAYLDWIEGIVWEDEIEPETLTFVFTN